MGLRLKKVVAVERKGIQRLIAHRNWHICTKILLYRTTISECDSVFDVLLTTTAIITKNFRVRASNDGSRALLTQICFGGNTRGTDYSVLI